MKQLFDLLTKKYRVYVLVLVLPVILCLVGTACRMDVGGPQPPYDSVSTSFEAASELETILQNAGTDQDSGTIAFTLTEEQVSSYLANWLENQNGILIKEPQVFLRNQQIEIYGVIEQEYIRADVCFILQVHPTEEGTLKVDLLYADVGMIHLPNDFLDSISNTIQEMLKINQFFDDTFSTGYAIETIDISNGMITVTGSKR